MALGAPPPALPVLVDQIPPALTKLDRWVVWRWTWVEDGSKSKWDKPPSNARTGERARVNDPATWSKFDAAVAAYTRGGWDGLGVVLTADDDLTGVDLDHCVAGDSIDPEAERDVAELDSYTERSPSGTGIRVVLCAKKPPGRCKLGTFEVYDRGRYLTITGHVLDGRDTIERRQEQLDAWHARRFPAPSRKRDTAGPAAGNGSHPLTDGELLKLAGNAKNAAKFNALYGGSDELYGGDTSSADLALCSMLAFWTQDGEQIDRIFRGSRRMRSKWNDRRGETTWGAQTVAAALDGTTEHYTPPPPTTMIGDPPDASSPNGQADDDTGTGGADPDREDHARGDDTAAAPDGYRLTDAGNSSRLVNLAAGRIRYVHAWGKWIVYRHGRWELDANDALTGEVAKRVARSLFALLPKAKTASQREALFKWAVRSESAGAIAAMVRLARGINGVIVEHDQLDADPLILNVRNGTIQLATGQFRPHDPTDLCTLQVPVSYDPDAHAPRWEACLQRWHPDPAVRGYLQRWGGGAATGRYTETADFNIGDGGNGKSKFFGALQGVLGIGPHGYALAPHKSLLLLQRHEQHETVKADLFRKRLLVASETNAGDGLDEEQVKNLTGGDNIRCRRMREDSWFFWPTHTLALMTNHAPAVRGRDTAIWRRIRVVPWTVTIPDAEQDGELAAKLHAEAAGILNWLIAGARLWLSEGNPPPKAVRVASDEYRASQDLVGRFVDDVLRIGRSPQDQTSSQAIKAALERWCAEQGESEVPDFGVVTKLLKAKGCTNRRSELLGHRMMRWSPVALAVEPEPSRSGSE